MWDRDHSISWLEVSIRICLIIIIFGVVIVAQLYWKDENKEKKTEKGPFKKIIFAFENTPHGDAIDDIFCIRCPHQTNFRNVQHTLLSGSLIHCGYFWLLLALFTFSLQSSSLSRSLRPTGRPQYNLIHVLCMIYLSHSHMISSLLLSILETFPPLL